MRRADFRTICDCQRHRGAKGFLRGSMRTAWAVSRPVRHGSIAFIIGVPLAFGAIGIPFEGMMNAAEVRPAEFARQRLQMFSPSPRVEPSPAPARHELTIELAKENFFRTAVPYGSIIYREAKRNELPPELVAAVVHAESDFRAHLVSTKNAQGLMQIVPATGRSLGVANLLDPAANIAAGTRYLRYLVDRFRNPRLALAAYNAGEGNVEKWGGIPPFPETLAYLSRVDRHTREYRHRARQTWARELRRQASLQ